MPRDLAGRRGYTRYGAEAGEEDLRASRSNMRGKDGASGDDLFDVYRRDFLEWDEQTCDDRDEAIRARDFYDGRQWTDKEIAKLNERRQPVLTKNLIAPKVNFVLGSETENRVSPKAYPRTMYHEMDAEVVTDGLRYVTEADGFDQTRSGAAGDMLIEGYGGAVFDVEPIYQDGNIVDAHITLEHVLWDRLYYDPRSRKHDFSDAKFLGIIVWMYRDDALDFFIKPGMSPAEIERIESVIDTAYARDLTQGDATEDAPRDYTDGAGRVQFFQTYRQEGGVWYEAFWTWAGWVHEPEEVEFVDEHGNNFCPLIMGSAFIDRDNARYGIVKHMISPQEEVNKRASRALHLMHTIKVISEVGAIQDPDTFQQEMSKPDGNPQVLPGRLKDKAIQVLENVQLAQAQMVMQERAEAAINQIGPHAALVSADQRIQSGRMFMARQQAGAMEIKPVFDHLRHWTLRAFERYWYLIRQFWTSEKWFRVRDDQMHQGNRFVFLNREMTKAERIQELIESNMPPADAVSHVLGPDGVTLLRRIAAEVEQAQAKQQQDLAIVQEGMALAAEEGTVPEPEIKLLGAQAALPPADPLQLLLESQMAQEAFTANDVAQLDVDIVLDTAPASPIVRHEQFAELLNLASTTLAGLNDPNVTKKMVALLFQHSDLRQEAKRQFVEALTPESSPEEEAMQQQQMQMQMQAMQMELAKLGAEVQKSKADAAKAMATAQREAAETQVSIPADAQLKAAQAAKAMGETQLKPDEADLLQAQAVKAEADAEKSEAQATVALRPEPKQVPKSTGGN